MRAAAQPASTGAFQNLADPDHPDWAEAYYGDNLERLTRIRSLYDPDDVFHQHCH